MYFSSKIELAQGFTKLMTLGENKYKVVLQCRLNPTKTSVPESTSDLYVVSKNEDIRPYGILVRKVVS
jgi:hypothetical protein